MNSFRFFTSPLRQSAGLLLGFLALAAGVLFVDLAPLPAQAAGTISVEILAAPNLVVDANAASASTHAPSAATVAGKICNTSPSASVSQVTAYIGTHTGTGSGTSGIYPARLSSEAAFIAQHPALQNTGAYSLAHMGGSLGTQDAIRYIGDLAPGECVVQYWHFTYPQCSNTGPAWIANPPPCESPSLPVWGNAGDTADDLRLSFDVWAADAGGANWNVDSQTVTLRAESAAAASQVKPNPGGLWFNTTDPPVYPGETITTNGIGYTFGPVTLGFDDDGNSIPDLSAWLQPVGEAAFDPSCFRLVHTSGVLTVTRSSGPDMIIPLEDDLYVTNLPPDNTNVTGEVFYTFLALDGPCTSALSPYQASASGYNSESFNADYGTIISPLQSQAPVVTLAKSSAPETIPAAGGTLTYHIPFTNTVSQAAGLPSSGLPLVIQDTVPDGLTYLGGSAAAQSLLSFTPNNGFSIRYSTDSGATWSATDPGDRLSTWPAGKVMLQWWLNDPLPADHGGSYAGYQAAVAVAFARPLIENCAQASFGANAPFAEFCTDTVVQGTASIGDRVWLDQNGDTLQAGENGISGITVWLYWDRNGNARLDGGDRLIKTTETSGTGVSNYDFTALPAAKYIVKVDGSDAQLFGNTAPTTADTLAVTLALGQDDNDADFGFAPALRIEKRLETAAPPVIGEKITFSIDLVNALPGDSSAVGYCVYYVWPSTAATGGGTNDSFANPNNALGAPNSTYANADFSGGANRWMSGSAFASGGRSSGITKVEGVYNFYLNDYLVDDYLTVSMSGGAAPWSDSFAFDEMNRQAAGEDARGYLTSEIAGTYAPGGAWDWDDFNVPGLTLQVDVDKNGSGEATSIYLDAFGFRVTTDDPSCTSINSTISWLPLDDTFDPAYLQFVSADPPPSSTGVGSLHWDNLGPLYAGGTRTVTVNFTALAAVNDTTNTVKANEARFLNGNDTNDAGDSATVDITASGSISGRVFANTTTTGGWVTGTGYGGGDTFFPGTRLQLWGCFSTITGLILTDATLPPGGDNQPCTDSANGGEWLMIATTVTGDNGAYSFTGLRDGFYNVIVDTSTLPPGFTNSVETDRFGTGNGGTGGDSYWNALTADLGDFNAIVNGLSGETIGVVSFGYVDGGATLNQGAVLGYVWNDRDENGVWDKAAEEPVRDVVVYLCPSTTDPCTSSATSAVTDVYGRYIFGDLAPGSYRSGIDTAYLPGMSQSGDPDESGKCVTCDDQNTTAFSVLANVVTDAGDFGYYGGLAVSGTLYADWDGDGAYDGSAEEGIAGVALNLYRDVDGDGLIDPGDALLAGTVSGLNGQYQFTGLAGNGSHYLVVVNPTGLPEAYVQTGDPDAAIDNQSVVTLTSDDAEEIDFGYHPTGFGAIGNFVWYDTDSNGIPGAGESGAANISLYLYEDQGDDGLIDAEDATIASTETLNYAVIDGYIDISGNGSIGAEDTLTGSGLYGYKVYDGALDVNGSTTISIADDGPFGPYAVIDGRLDLNADGSPTTDDDGSLKGFYLFKNLRAGTYIVQVAATEFTAGDLVGHTMTTLTVDYNLGQKSYRLSLEAGQVNYHADFGFAPPALIGDFVYFDANANGALDAGETGFDGLAVNLYAWNDDGDGVLEASETGALKASTTTASGTYQFSNLDPGRYVVQVTPPSSATYTPSADPDAYNVPCLLSGPIEGQCNHMAGVTLLSGQVNRSLDFGYMPLRTIGDRVWLDADGNGLQGGMEPGIAGLSVTLRNCGSDSSCGEAGETTVNTLTDAGGNYVFTVPDTNLYRLEINTPPSNTTPTYDYDGGADNRAQVDMSLVAPNFRLADFGYRATFAGNNTINGTIWHDSDQDKAIGAGEAYRYANQTVYLWNNSGSLVATAVTDAAGFYQFSSLPDGTYIVAFNGGGTGFANLTATTSMSQSFTLGGTETKTKDFGFYSALDLGDLPASYNLTSLGMDGPRHQVSGASALRLGTRIDTDPYGDDSPLANSDDINQSLNDEDGVTLDLYYPWTHDYGGRVNISVDNCASTCYISAWVDWGRNNNFSDPGDRVLLDHPISDNVIMAPDPVIISIPAGHTVSGQYFARFRVYSASTNGTARPTGYASDGEVEDYYWNFSVTAVEMVALSATSQPAFTGTFIWLSAAALLGAGSLLAFKAWRKRA